MIELVQLSAIHDDHRAQPRCATMTDLVEKYVKAMAEGEEFPPIVVFRDGEDFYIGDGFHRFYAYQGLGLVEVECDVRPGGLQAAILHSCSANIHGVPRTNEDKRRAVTTLFNDALVSVDPETGVPWSDRAIARICKVSNTFVSKQRPHTVNVDSMDGQRTFTHWRTGEPTTMDTSRIGTKPSAPRREWSEDNIFDDDREPEPRSPPPVPTGPRFDDPTHAYISAALWEIDRQIRSLPAPTTAIERFPSRHHHTLSASRLREWADWFNRAADAWDEIVGDRNVAAE